MKKVLVITHSKDHARVEVACQEMREKGAEVIRLDCDQYLTKWELNTTYSGKWFLEVSDGTHSIDAKDITAVWLRRMHNFAEEAAQQITPEYVVTAMGEANTIFTGFLNSLDHAFHLNHFSQNRVAEIKTWQLKVAERLGLKIPKTCISNNPDVVRQFVESCGGKAAVKMQDAQSVKKEDGNYVVYTSKIETAQIDDSIRLAPMTFQAFIPKTIEYRVTIVGREVFAIALDTAQQEAYKVDWRREASKSVDFWSKAQLPQDIIDKLYQYMDFYHLNYGAADILFDPETGYHFLEMNPGGEFDWVNGYWHGKLVTAIGDILLGNIPRRSCSPYFTV